MGWTCIPRTPNQTLLQHIIQDLSPHTVLKYHKHGSTYYIAAQTPDQSQVFGMVYLTRTTLTEYQYKDIHEIMGPIYYDAPKSLIDMLSPSTNPYAIRWRAKCSTPKLTNGTRIKTKRPLPFGRNTYDTFTKVQYPGKRNVWITTPDRKFVQLPTYITKDPDEYEILT